MSITIKDLIFVLETILGCECDKSGDHIRYTLKVNGRVVARTKYSYSWRGNQQIDDTIMASMAKGMQCSNKTWKLLLQGQLTKEDYFKELLAKNVITQAEFDALFPPKKQKKP